MTTSPSRLPHHADCTCKPCLVDAVRQVLAEEIRRHLDQPEERGLTYRQAGEILGCSHETIGTLVRSGQLPAIYLGRTPRIVLSVLHEWMRDHVGERLDLDRTAA